MSDPKGSVVYNIQQSKVSNFNPQQSKVSNFNGSPSRIVGPSYVSSKPNEVNSNSPSPMKSKARFYDK